MLCPFTLPWKRILVELSRISGLAALLLLLPAAGVAADVSTDRGNTDDGSLSDSWPTVSYVQPPDEAIEEPPAPDPLAELEALLEQPVLVSEPVATTVSRVEERAVEAAGTVYVYTRQVIQNRGYRSLGDLLRTVPGFTVFHRDLQFVVGVRGFNANDNDKVALLVNGQRVLGMHEQEFLNGPINLDNVERVEVVVGPSSLFQQANTLAATINVITRNVDGAQVLGSTGNELGYSGTVMVGRRLADDNYLSFSFTTEEKRGFDGWDAVTRPGLAGRDITGELDQPNYFSVLRWKNGGLAVQAIAYRTTLPELIMDNTPANNGIFREEYYSLFVDYEHAFNSDLTGVAKYRLDYKEQARQNRNNPPAPYAEQTTNHGELGFRYTGIGRHLFQAGVQAEHDDNFGAFGTTTLMDQGSYALGFYFDDQIDVCDRLKLIAGVRVDKNTRLPDRNDWFPGARAAVVYHTTENWVTKVTYNRSVRMPSALTALNRVWGSNNPPGPDNPAWASISPTANVPEILSTIELHNVFYIGERTRLGTIIYHEELADFITWFGPWSNGGDFSGDGFELTLDAEASPCLTIWANCAYNDTRLDLFNPVLFGPGTGSHSYVDFSGRIIGSPDWTANLGVDWKLTECLTFSPAVRYFTEQAAVEQLAPATRQFVNVRNQFYFDAGLTWNDVLRRDMDIRLAARNIFGNRDPVGAQMLGGLYHPRGPEVTVTLDARF